MRNAERIAITRIIADLIKADSIIDVGEMEMYALLKDRYGISRLIERQASDISLAYAVQVLQQSDRITQKEFLQVCGEMTVSDGFCDPTEAMIMLALKHTLYAEDNGGLVLSIYEPDVKVEPNQVLYIESQYDKSINREITDNYRNIVNEWRSAGMNFVYLPKVAEHYAQFSDSTFRDVAAFLSPTLSNDELSSVVQHLSHLTTTEFCKEQIVARLGMSMLGKVGPSLMLKISSGYVGHRLYGNFLCVGVNQSVVETTQMLRDEYVGMLSSDRIAVSNVEEAHGRFLYRAFYKQIFDMYTLRTGEVSRIEINPYRGEIKLVDIGRTLEGLKRKEKALYMLLIYFTLRYGGIRFSPPKKEKECKGYAEQAERVMLVYNKIYELFGGEKDAAPDLFAADIRRPMVANIRKSVKQVAPMLQNASDYSIRKDDDDVFDIPIDKSLVSILTINGLTNIKEIQY